MLYEVITRGQVGVETVEQADILPCTEKLSLPGDLPFTSGQFALNESYLPARNNFV